MLQETHPQEVLTLETAAQVLDIAPRTLRRWLKEKDIPYAKLGRDIRIMRSSLMAWLKEQEQATMAGQSVPDRNQPM